MYNLSLASELLLFAIYRLSCVDVHIFKPIGASLDHICQPYDPINFERMIDPKTNTMPYRSDTAL